MAHLNLVWFGVVGTVVGHGSEPDAREHSRGKGDGLVWLTRIWLWFGMAGTAVGHGSEQDAREHSRGEGDGLVWFGSPELGVVWFGIASGFRVKAG